jgi:Tol biopolymer transport system component
VPLATGTRVGSYEIVSALGAGGMGEVYRARDTKLNRDVALKILPEAFAADPDRLARFTREAQTLAALNHPHIAHIHGLEESEGVRALVMELVDGETLAVRIARGAVPSAEALVLARQIAEALEAAHERGIIHRDLKPANIALTTEGQVKVLDFGLAKALDPVAGSDVVNSPTLTFAGTQAGIILGTAAYMSPEQAKGRAADKRSDIWAFGCVFYEMLTGRRAFQGEDVSDTLAAVLRGDPDWSALPPAVPEQIRLLLKRCLEKDRRARIADIAVARFLMTETLDPSPASVVAAPAPTPSWRRLAAGTLGGLVAGAAVTMLVAGMLSRRTVAPPRPPARFVLTAQAGQALAIQGADRSIDISADGTFIAYRGISQTQSRLYVRALGELDSRPLTGGADLNDVRAPFFSPDGRWIGFFSGQEMRKVQVTGGPVITLCRVQGLPRGASWGSDDTIVYSTADMIGLMGAPAGGGEPKVLFAAGPDGVYAFPSVLPGGKAVLFTILRRNGSPDGAQIAVLDRTTGERKVLLTGGTSAQYADGFLVYAAAGTLRAVRFDLDRLAVLSDPVPVVDQVMTTNIGMANFAVSRGGSLVYVPGNSGSSIAPQRSLVWVNRQGRETPTKLPIRAYGDVHLSPDGTRLAVGIRDQQADIWIGDLVRQTLTRLTFDPTVDQAPVWMPDGRRILWSAQAGSGVPNLFMQSADGTGAVEHLLANGNPRFPTSVSPDGTHAVFFENDPRTAQDIMMLDLQPQTDTGPRQPRPLIHTSAVELAPEISPDGRWLAYQSNESGQAEVFVRPFPDVDHGRWQVSTAGGTRPAWARNGRELFYLDRSSLLTSVPVHITGSTFEAGSPVTILTTKYYPGFTGLGLDLRGYDVSPDGQRFLMIKDGTPGEQASFDPSAHMIVVLNWLEELKTRLPASK